MTRRDAARAGFLLLMSLGSSGCGGAGGAPRAEEAFTEIASSEPWYRVRPEPEREWHGRLRRREVPGSPAARASASLELLTKGGTITVYSAASSATLERLEGRDVVLRGKLVDLTTEGFGPELWVGAIRVKAAHGR